MTLLAAMDAFRVVISVVLFIVIPVVMLVFAWLILRSIKRSGERIEAKLAAAQSISQEGFASVKSAIEGLPEKLASRTYTTQPHVPPIEPPRAA
jgi:hypothetical protein